MTEEHEGTRAIVKGRSPGGGTHDDPGSRSSKPCAGWIAASVAIGLAVLLVLLALALAGGSLASYDSVKSHLDSFASDGNADLTRDEFDVIVVRLRIAAAMVALAALGLILARRRVAIAVSGLSRSAAISAADLYRGLTRAAGSESRLHLSTLALLTLIALLVRLEFLFQPMRYDESVTFVHYASQPWYIAVTNYTAPNNHVLHSLLVHVSTSFFGVPPWAVRLPALLAGVLLVPAAYLAARALYDKHTGLVAAGLVGGSSALVEYSTNARGYTLLALVCVLLVALATRLASSWSPAEWLLFAVLGAIGFFTVPVMLYAFGGIVLWLAIVVWPRDRRLVVHRLLPSVVAACALSVLLYAPIIATNGLEPLIANDFVRALPWRTFLADTPDSLASVARQWSRDMPLVGALVLATAFVVAVAYHRRLSPFSIPPALAVLAWLVPVVAAQRVIPFDRVWLFLLPLYLATAAAGIVFVLRPLATRAGGTAVVAAVVAIGLAGALGGKAVASQAVYESEETSTFRDGEDVAALLQEKLRPGDKVLVAPPADGILEYWLDVRGLEPATLLYWGAPGSTRRFLAVVKDGPKDYPLEHLLGDPRVRGVRVLPPVVVQRFPSSTVYEIRRIATD